MTTLTSLPPSPQRSNPDTHAIEPVLMAACCARLAWVVAVSALAIALLAAFVAELERALISGIIKFISGVNTDSKAFTHASAKFAKVSGTTYSVGDLRYSPTDFQTYRRKTTGAGTTDPSLDLTNWLRVSGDVSSNTTQTLTNKTLNSAVFNDGYTEEVFSVTGTAPALSPANGSIQTWVLSANSAPTAGTWGSGQSLTLMIDDGSAFSVNWASLSVVWKTNLGTAPILQTNGYTVIQLWKVGTVIYGARVGDA